jgi:hypothetical protein
MWFAQTDLVAAAAHIGHIEVSEFSQPEVGLADSIIASMGSLGRR